MTSKYKSSTAAKETAALFRATVSTYANTKREKPFPYREISNAASTAALR
jgi:hypothetical protein